MVIEQRAISNHRGNYRKTRVMPEYFAARILRFSTYVLHFSIHTPARTYVHTRTHTYTSDYITDSRLPARYVHRSPVSIQIYIENRRTNGNWLIPSTRFPRRPTAFEIQIETGKFNKWPRYYTTHRHRRYCRVLRVQCSILFTAVRKVRRRRRFIIINRTQRSVRFCSVYSRRTHTRNTKNDSNNIQRPTRRGFQRSKPYEFARCYAALVTIPLE